MVLAAMGVCSSLSLKPTAPLYTCWPPLHSVFITDGR